MTLEDAVSLLGVERGASAELVRRAYLRKVRQRPPEHDPVGFLHLREAFEFVHPNALQGWPTEESVASEPALAQENDPLEKSNDPRGDRTTRPVSPAEPAADGGPPEEGAIEHYDWPSLAASFERDLTTSPAEPPPLFVSTTAVLELLQSGDIVAAGRLAAAVDGWLATSASAPRPEPATQLALWLLVRDLAVVAGRLPSALVAPLAQAVDSREPAAATHAFRQLRASDPWVAKDAAVLLSKSAPSLWSFVGRAVLPSRLATWAGCIAFAFGLAAILWAFSWIGSGFFRQALEPGFHRHPDAEAICLAREREARQLDAAVRNLGRMASAADADRVLRGLDLAASALMRGGCVEAREKVAQLRSEASEAGLFPGAELDLSSLEKLVELKCAATTPPGTTPAEAPPAQVPTAR